MDPPVTVLRVIRLEQCFYLDLQQFAALRVPLLRIDPAQRHRLEEIRDNLHDRIAEAEREGWTGEAEGLKVSLAAATSKLAQADATTARRAEHVHLGIPAYRDIAAVTLAVPGDPMDTDHLAAALRAYAAGLYPLEAGIALLISDGTFLHRDDFTSRFIETRTSISDGATPMAAIDWHAAITALQTGELPCSGGERRILQLSGSLAAGIPIDLRDGITGLDTENTARLVIAIRHASGNRPGKADSSNSR